MRPIVMLLAIAVIAAAPAHAGEWQRSWTVHGVPAFTLDVDDARVEIRGWDRDEISVKIESDRSVGIETGKDLRVTARQNGDAVSVRIERPHVRFMIGVQWRETRIEVRVPRQSRLDVHTGDGACEIDGVRGDVSLESGDGSINAEDVSGHMRFHTSDGAIRGHGLEGDLVAETSDGRIEVFGTFGRLELSSSDGRIVAGAGPGSRVEGPWDLHTGDGRITLRIPDALAATLDARTGDGRVTLRSNEPLRGEVGSRMARVDLKGGGESIRLRSGDGSIRVECYAGALSDDSP